MRSIMFTWLWTANAVTTAGYAVLALILTPLILLHMIVFRLSDQGIRTYRARRRNRGVSTSLTNTADR